MGKQEPLGKLSVWLGQTLVGSITELPNDRNLFVFDEGFTEDRNRPVLSLSFLNAEGDLASDPIITQEKVPPFFSNLLPEDDLRRYVARRANVKAVRDLPLLRVLGEDLPGAVVVRSENEGPPTEKFEESLESNDPSEESRPLRFSLAGVQMKFSAGGSPGKGLAIPVEGLGGHWILKLPSQKYPMVPENEHSMMQFASAVGITVAESGLVATEEIEGLPDLFRVKENSLWVRRFDRRPDNSRVHMEDFNQVYQQFPRYKYENYSYGNMAKDLATVAGMDAVSELVRRLVFCAAIGNMDMHLKNWTLLYEDGRTPTLSPAYDLVSTIAYMGDVRMALSVAKEKDVRKFDDELLKRFAARIPVPEREILDAAHETAERVVHTWPRIMGDLLMNPDAKQRVTEQLHLFPLTRQLLM